MVGLFFRMFWGVFLVLPPPDNFFAGAHIVVTFFYITDIYFFPDCGGFNFLRELIFFFSWEGGGIKRGWSTFEYIYILFLREHAGPGVWVIG